MDVRVDTVDDPSNYDKNLVNFGPVNIDPVTQVLQARLCRAGYPLGFAMRLVQNDHCAT